MSWIRNSPLGMSFSRRSVNTSPSKDCDKTACLDSFKRHWLQAYEIITRTEANPNGPSADDVLGIVNNLEQITSLLVIELQNPASLEEQPCLDHLLSEGILDKILNWSKLTSRYNNLRLEQLKLYEMLLSNAPQRNLLIHEPFLRPLMSLLSSCANEMFTSDTEKRLILLLNQLCVCLTKNPSLLDLFFSPNTGQNSFIIFSLLIPYVHREGGVGQQARDAMLLCMSLSKNNETLANYILKESNICPILATGLSGLFARLPRKLLIETEDWCSFTPDDVNEMPELTLFINSLEFYNAIVQVSQPNIRSQLLEFIYHGFLVPVIGPALLQSVAEELVATSAYFELSLRSVTEPGLLEIFLRFLFGSHYDGERVIDRMIQRLSGRSRLSLVSLALFNTIINFNCEDVMLELIFKFLIPCTHVMLSQRKRIKDIDFYSKSAEKFLSLSPSCFYGKSTSPYGNDCMKRIDSLQGDYGAYLLDAKMKIESSMYASKFWKYKYDGENPEQIPQGNFIDKNRNLSKETSLVSEASSGYESFVNPSENETTKDKFDVSVFQNTPDIGPFLEIILQQLDNMINNGLYINLQLTGLISRLAAFPQPLLTSFLLNTSLVFQPSNKFKSLFQILGSLRQRIDAKLRQFDNIQDRITEAELFLLDREEKIVNARRLAQDNLSFNSTTPDSRRGSTSSESSFVRNSGGRRSLSSTISSVFKRATQNAFTPVREHAIEYHSNGVRSWKRTDDSELKQIVLCAVLLDEWLKELAALSQEHVALHCF